MAANREETALLRKELDGLLEGDAETLRARLLEAHAADVADWMHDLEPEEARRVFLTLTAEHRAEILEEAEDALQQELIEDLPAGELTEIVEELPADEVVDLLSLVDDEKSEAVLGEVDFARAAGLRELGAHAADTAGGQMTTEFTVARSGMRIGDLIKEIKSAGEDAGELKGAFVIDADGKPVGYVTDRDLLTHSIHDVVDEVMTQPFTIGIDADQEEAANVIMRYSLEALAVVDEAGVLVGILDTEDAQEVLEEEVSEDLMRIVGAQQTHQTRLPVLQRVRHRLPLQALTVVGGLATAFILEVLLKDQKGEALALLRFIPIVIGLAGNVGIQASTILVRAFATGEVEPERERSVLTSEVLTGLIIGLLCGAITLPVAAWMQGPTIAAGLPFGSAVGLAITAAVTWAAFLGCAVPMSCRRLGIDPAVVAGPFLITLSDISGTAIFAGGAKLMLTSL